MTNELNGVAYKVSATIDTDVTGAQSPNLRIRKAVNTLAIVPKSERISLLARKIYNVMLHYAQRQGVDQPFYRVRLRDIAGGIDFNSNNTEVIKQHLRQMVSTVVEWQSPTTGEGSRWSLSGLVSHADITMERGELMLEWSYARNIKQELLDPQRFAKISLHFQIGLKSTSGLVLYEICSRYVDNPSGLTARQSWKWWWPVLTGSPTNENSVQEYKYFKRDVLKKAINEVTRVTDIDVELIEHKTGRTIKEIQFRIQKKPQPTVAPLHGVAPVDLRVVGAAIKAGISQEKAEKFMDKYGSKAVDAAVKVLNERQTHARLEQVRQPDQFLNALLKSGNFGDRKDEKLPAIKLPDTKSARIALIEKFRARKRIEIEAIFKEMPECEQRDLLVQFENEELPEAMCRIYSQKGVSSSIIRPMFLKYLGHKMWGGTWDHPSDTELLELSLNG
ncbi:MAG: replication initiation protein [Ottowia sp.]|nr:replication initiation protein [Ottowia sp.]